MIKRRRHNDITQTKLGIIGPAVDNIVSRVPMALRNNKNVFDTSNDVAWINQMIQNCKSWYVV